MTKYSEAINKAGGDIEKYPILISCYNNRCGSSGWEGGRREGVTRCRRPHPPGAPHPSAACHQQLGNHQHVVEDCSAVLEHDVRFPSLPALTHSRDPGAAAQERQGASAPRARI